MGELELSGCHPEEAESSAKQATPDEGPVQLAARGAHKPGRAQAPLAPIRTGESKRLQPLRSSTISSTAVERDPEIPWKSGPSRAAYRTNLKKINSTPPKAVAGGQSP